MKVIYGAGTFGKRLYDCMEKRRETIDYFVVSQKSMADKAYKGICVIEMENLPLNEADITIFVATNEVYHTEIRDNLINRFGVGIEDNVIFMKKSDIDRMYRECFPAPKKISINETEPVSRLFGNDRGKPIDRYYIEKYLQNESVVIGTGKWVLEVGESTYSELFFPGEKHSILDYSKGQDLTRIDSLEKAKYDVFICTQVFQQIYDVKAAIQGAYYVLKDDGVLLATVCGTITKQAKNSEYNHYWGFTEASIGQLVRDVFGSNVRIESYGNAAVATAFVQGYALEEVEDSILDVFDEEYTICISITAKK